MPVITPGEMGVKEGLAGCSDPWRILRTQRQIALSLRIIAIAGESSGGIGGRQVLPTSSAVFFFYLQAWISIIHIIGRQQERVFKDPTGEGTGDHIHLLFFYLIDISSTLQEDSLRLQSCAHLSRTRFNWTQWDFLSRQPKDWAGISWQNCCNILHYWTAWSSNGSITKFITFDWEGPADLWFFCNTGVPH